MRLTVLGPGYPFRGGIAQVPPAISALKRGGRPMYEHVRRGREVPALARRLGIGAAHGIEIPYPKRDLYIRSSEVPAPEKS